MAFALNKTQVFSSVTLPMYDTIFVMLKHKNLFVKNKTEYLLFKHNCFLDHLHQYHCLLK